jgi:surfeit locus 1 family protein
MSEYIPMPKRVPRFAPRLVPTLLMCVAVAAFVALGRWQLGRAAERRAILEDFAADGPAVELRRLPDDAPRYQRVAARGHYDPERQFLLDNRVYAGRPGVHVLTPLVLNDGSAVIVDRGWLPYGRSRSDLPSIDVGADPRALSGRIDDLPRPPVELESRTPAGWPKVVQYPRMEELAALLDRELHPRLILLDPWEPDGYGRDWAPPGPMPARNLAYAVQWFAFAGVAVAAWIVVTIRRREAAQ